MEATTFPSTFDVRPWTFDLQLPISAETIWLNDGGTPKSLSLKTGRQPVRTFSFTFPEGPQSPVPQKRPTVSSPPLPLAPSSATSQKPLTRIRPPGDIIKLED